MIVQTKKTTYQGIVEKGIGVFKGIPYAEVPYRFKHAILREDKEETVDATNYGYRAMQEDTTTMPPVSEDCLTLNIWTKETTKKKPVVVWVHGGGFVGGSNSELQYKGNDFATDDIVFINVNYRLGIFGFLQVDTWLGKEYHSSGNAGVSDLVTALQWIKDNIAYFGGNPEEITIMGESAGAKMAATLLVVPEAKGLFQRMVLQSGALQSIRSKETATAIAQEFCEVLGITLENAQKLLQYPAEKLIEAQKQVMARYICPLHVFGPVIDGTYIPTTEHLSSHVPLLIGFNKEESRCFLDGEVSRREKIVLEHLFGENSELVWIAYQKACETMTEEKAWEEVLTHYFYAKASEELACEMGGNVWFYRFDWDGPSGACHAQDIPFVFHHRDYKEGNHHIPLHARPLAAYMHEQWKVFIKSGVLHWSRYHRKTKRGMTFNVESKEAKIELLFNDAFPRECFGKKETTESLFFS